MKTSHQFVLRVVELCSASGLLQALSLMHQGSTQQVDDVGERERLGREK
jgi:hypothetical protein